MKAIVANDFQPLDKLVLADWPEPAAGKGQIVIEAEAMGVNFPDGLLVQGLYQLKPPTPFVPGMETAPWQLLAPSAVLALLLLCLNFLGDGLRDALDPRQS